MRYEEGFHGVSDRKAIFVRRWLPETAPKAILLVAHGMAEHGARYERLGKLMADAGWAVIVPDLRGHGRTAGADELGWFSEKNGFCRICDDLHEIVQDVKKTIAQDKPIFLFGHSMGSILAEFYSARYGDELSGCALSGIVLPASGALLAFGKCTSTLGALLFGQRKPARFLDTMGFAAYNNAFKPERTKFDWLSRDPSEVDKYVADPLCGFVCSFGFYKDLFSAFSSLYGKAAALDSIPKTLPMLVLSGSEDPAGGKDRFADALVSRLKTLGIAVQQKVYPGARHEILNETNRDEVLADLKSWLQQRLA